MAHLGVSETLPAIPILPTIQKPRKRVSGFPLKQKKDTQEQNLHTTRRTLALGLASIPLFHISNNIPAFAAGDNGYWYNDFIPTVKAKNNITNEKTGTRSFVNDHVYIVDLDIKNRAYRLHKSAFDLLAMEDLVKPDTLNYVRKYLRFKSTFMYFDFDRIISAVPEDQKQPLTTLANKLFDSFEELLDAAKAKDFSRTESRYKDTKVILEEVMARDIRGAIGGPERPINGPYWMKGVTPTIPS